MNTFPTIYKRTNTGKIQIWYAEQDGALYRTTSGQLDGKLVTTNWTEALPKNQGRANATTAEQQATSEINSEYSKKLAKDYHRNIADVDQEMRYNPMLANKWKDRVSKLQDTDLLFIQPKLDGCVSGNGVVITELGARKVEDVFNGPDETILSYNEVTDEIEFNSILGKFKNAPNTEQPKKWLLVTTESGKQIKLTDNHRIYLPNIGAWRQAADLCVGDVLLALE